MIFTLEVLQAYYGDCILLHFGDKRNPKVFIIDGGPQGIYHNFLKPRLLAIKDNLAPDGPLPVSMVMLSHLDDDHINGLNMLLNEMAENQRSQLLSDFDIQNLWFNSFDDIIGNIQIPVISSFSASASATSSSLLPPEIREADDPVQAVISSTAQGRQLRDDAHFLSIPVNDQFKALPGAKGKMVISAPGSPVIKWSDQLKIHLIHPDSKRLLKLQKQWDKDLKKAKEKGDNSIVFSSIATSKDTSVFNLSSIVCLLELNGKTILLTGDARSDDIMDGLKEKELLDAEGKLHVNILKLPHHGSHRNIFPEFFQAVTADHYVISADGKYGNPDKETLDMLAEGTKGRDNFTIHLTNRDGDGNLKKLLTGFYTNQKKAGRKFKMKYRTASKPSMLVELLDKIDF